MGLAFLDYELLGGPNDGDMVRINNIVGEFRVALPRGPVSFCEEVPSHVPSVRIGQYLARRGDREPLLHWEGEMER